MIEYRNIELEKDALAIHLMIMEWERSDFEAQIAQLESREFAINQKVEELKTQMEELVR